MSDFSSLRPPASPSGRASSPVGGMNPSRYSLNSMGKAPTSAGGSGGAGSVRTPSSGNPPLPTTPRSAARADLRPRSELVGRQHRSTGGNGMNAETDAIDKWFEDLQHYEATLEEMATASLDQNFKEELGAIEQWFRVLSEAERTAALYSLLQESTQVQIRFFITVLQQMARTDPMSALLSPGFPNQAMAEQMESKLASLGLKSPSAARTQGGSNAFRQSSDAAGFLSPNAAALYGANSNDMQAVLAAQRAKLKANRISAPGTLPGDQAGLRNFSGGHLDQVQENRNSDASSAGARPKSTEGLAAAAKSPRPSGPLDDQLSPITSSGNWSSMVNTPLMPMFGDDNANGNVGSGVSSNLDKAAAQLASVNDQSGRGVLLDQDVSKYRRKQGSGSQGFGGHSSPMTSPSATSTSPNLWSAPQNDFLRQAMASTSPLPNSGNSGSFNAQMSPNSLAGLQSPSGGLSNPMNMQMMNTMAQMGGLGNMSAAQFLQMQQQILQNQQQIAAMAAQGYPPSQQQQQQQQQQNQRQQQQPQSSSPYNSLGRDRGAGVGAALQGLSAPNAAMSNTLGRRSPGNARVPLPRTGAGAAGSGAGAGSAQAAAAHVEEDVTDLKLLQDIPNWLRVLRLHKYTPNFETTDWHEIVVMNDKALQDKGVAALGARRKMLKTFEQVREKHGIPHPPDSGIPDGEGEQLTSTSGGPEGPNGE